MKLIALLLLLIPAAHAEPNSTTQPFYRQVKLIEEIAPYVERVDMARLMIVKGVAQFVIDDIESNIAKGKKEITFKTLSLVQHLILQYNYSMVFFGWTEPRSITSIYTEVTADELAELKKLSEDMVDEFGYEESPYTMVTAYTFNLLKKNLDQLLLLPISPELKASLATLTEPIAATIAVANLGDRPKAFDAAILAIEQIRTLYPKFDEVASSDAGFPMIMEIQGMTEFYADYAQMEGREEK